MKVVRSVRSLDLSLPLDGLDMFLLGQLDMLTTASEIAEIAPCAADETVRRLERLAVFGLVELSGGPRARPRRDLHPGTSRATIAEAGPSRFDHRLGQRPASSRTQIGLGPVGGAFPTGRPIGAAVGAARTEPPSAGAQAALQFASSPASEFLGLPEAPERSERASGVLERDALPEPPRPLLEALLPSFEELEPLPLPDAEPITKRPPQELAWPPLEARPPGAREAAPERSGARTFARMTLVDEDASDRARATRPDE